MSEKIYGVTVGTTMNPEKHVGKAGKSAYQYACESGYTGTEEEFAQKMNSIANAVDGNEVKY